MTNAFTARPKVSEFVAELSRNRLRAAAGTKTAQKHNIPQSAELRLFSKKERNEPR